MDVCCTALIYISFIICVIKKQITGGENQLLLKCQNDIFLKTFLMHFDAL